MTNEHPAPHSRPSRPRLERPSEGRVVAGVARGLADHFDVSVTLVRAAFVLTAVLGGPGLGAYVVAMLLMPSDTQDQAPFVAWVDRTFARPERTP